jgi:hypothetical protein
MIGDYDYDEAEFTVNPPIIPEVERRRRKVRRLYGPTGNVILSVSDRPPVGFHQGERRR